MKSSTFIAAALLCAAIIPAQSVSHYYVDAVNGSDQNPGTMALPFQSLTYAIGWQTTDVHIHVMPGVYSPSTTGDFGDLTTTPPTAERIQITNYQNLTITGVDRDTCILDFGALDGVQGHLRIGWDSVDIEISHLTMRNVAHSTTSWQAGAIEIMNWYTNPPIGVDIHNCYFEQTYSTLIIWGGFDVAFHDNVITDTVPNTGTWPSVGIRIRTNVAKGDRTYIYNNTFYGNDQGISWSNDAANPQQWIANNIIANITGKGFADTQYPGTHIVFENNLAFNCATWNYDPVIGPNGTGPVFSATNLEVDPMLANPMGGDYSLLPGSPCIEAGSTLTHPYMMNDYAGNNRAVDSDENGIAIPEIGALETTDISMVVTNFAQGQTALYDIQSSNPSSYVFGALMISFTEAPAYNPWWGMSGPNMFGLLGTMVGFPGIQMQLPLPANPALDGMWIYTQFAGLKVGGAQTVIKGTGMHSGLL